MPVEDTYDNSVFINCPYDEQYRELLKVLLFTVRFCGFRPVLAATDFDSGRARHEKITEMICSCKYGIHDLSRMTVDDENELARLNMSFELGLDMGCKTFSDQHDEKYLLILDEEKYRYQEAISDLAGFDPKSHSGEPIEIAYRVRHWFYSEGNDIPGPSQIWTAFNEFETDFKDEATSEGWDEDRLEDMPWPEYIDYVEDWVTVTLSGQAQAQDAEGSGFISTD